MADECRFDGAPASVEPPPGVWVTRRRRASRWAAAGRSVGADGPRIATLLLDMGGVVIPTLFESVAVAGFPAGPLADEEPYARVERGEVPERDYWAALAEHRPDLDVGALWRACSRVRVEWRDAVGALGQRVRLVAFTNDMAHWFGADWPARFPELAAFDRILEATRLGAMKPDPEAFRRACAELGEAPQRCLFVDDLTVNLDGAAAAGLDTLLFDVRDPGRSVAALTARLGVVVPPPSPSRRVFSPR